MFCISFSGIIPSRSRSFEQQTKKIKAISMNKILTVDPAYTY